MRCRLSATRTGSPPASGFVSSPWARAWSSCSSKPTSRFTEPRRWGATRSAWLSRAASSAREMTVYLRLAAARNVTPEAQSIRRISISPVACQRALPTQIRSFLLRRPVSFSAQPFFADQTGRSSKPRFSYGPFQPFSQQQESLHSRRQSLDRLASLVAAWELRTADSSSCPRTKKVN